MLTLTAEGMVAPEDVFRQAARSAVEMATFARKRASESNGLEREAFLALAESMDQSASAFTAKAGLAGAPC